MSRVTSVVLLVESKGDVTDEMLRHLHRPDQRLRKMAEGEDEWPGGTKYLEVDLWAGGLNYVPGNELEKWFESLPWGTYGKAVMVWETNGEISGFISVNWIDKDK
jgi:hypothetical protein